MNIYKFFRPLVFLLNPEFSHNLAIKFLKSTPNFATLFCLNRKYENLQTKVCNIEFDNPIGLAAGFDKNAEIVPVLAKFGFGFLEVGTVTPKAQLGNVKPRIFRLIRDRAIINRLGFNNKGSDYFANNVEQILFESVDKKLVFGINIGKNKDSADGLKDYLYLMQKFYIKAPYITINISSPNTANLRDLQKDEHLESFLSGIMNKKNELKEKCNRDTPIFLKIAPDLTYEEQEKIANAVLRYKIDGVIISNTTISREFNLKSRFASKEGGLSGKPLFDKSNEILCNFYKLTEGKIPLIGVGGVFSAEDAYQKIKSGASLVQIYSAFIYRGFGLVERIKKDLSKMVVEDGFENISQAIGSNTK